MEKQNYEVVIDSQNKYYRMNLGEVLQYKDLIWLFVKRNFSAQYKQTVLGPLWFVINPLLTSVISTIIFGNIAGIGSDGVPYFLFYLVGYTLWNYFSTCVNATSNTFTANASIMGKVYFPRLTMPISSVIFAAVNMLVIFAVSIIALVIFCFRGYRPHIGVTVLIIPVLMFQTAILGLGVGIIISSLTTKYRDLIVLVGFGLNLWMYLTPVVYPISEVPIKLKPIILANPMSAVVQNYKYALLGVGSFELVYWVISVVVTAILFIFGVMLFNKVEKTFMDTV